MPTISALTAGTTLAGTEVFPEVQSSTTVKGTINDIKTYVAPLTTKGDILAYSTANVRVAVGTNGQVLMADSGATPGVSYQNPNKTLPTRGTATLSSGAATVSTALVTANSLIFLTAQSLGTVSTPKTLAVTARTASTSFTITSADNTDTSVVAWFFFEPSS
jgi:hypothetical protein